MPENQTEGHDVPYQQTSTSLLAEIGKRGEYLLDVEQDRGWVLWLDDAAAAEKAKRDCVPWVLAHHDALVAEVRACSPAMRDWNIPAHAEVRAWDWGKESVADDTMPIAEAVEWLRPWWQRGVNFAVREEGVWLLLRGETAQQASRCLEEVKAAWPAICAALDIPEETSLCGWRRAEG